MERCWICTEPNAHACPGCQAVYYCGLEHQEEDWFAGHSIICSTELVKLPPRQERDTVADMADSEALQSSTELIFKEYVNNVNWRQRDNKFGS